MLKSLRESALQKRINLLPTQNYDENYLLDYYNEIVQDRNSKVKQNKDIELLLIEFNREVIAIRVLLDKL